MTDLEIERDEIIDRIVDHRNFDGKYQYLVKFNGADDRVWLEARMVQATSRRKVEEYEAELRKKVSAAKSMGSGDSSLMSNMKKLLTKAEARKTVPAMIRKLDESITKLEQGMAPSPDNQSNIQSNQEIPEGSSQSGTRKEETPSQSAHLAVKSVIVPEPQMAVKNAVEKKEHYDPYYDADIKYKKKRRPVRPPSPQAFPIYDVNLRKRVDTMKDEFRTNLKRARNMWKMDDIRYNRITSKHYEKHIKEMTGVSEVVPVGTSPPRRGERYNRWIAKTLNRRSPVRILNNPYQIGRCLRD